MRTVVADSGPPRYLVMIGEIDILPKLMGHVLIPPEVKAELDRPQTPVPVRTWITAPPSWLTVQPGPDVTDPALAELDPGERAAIALALSTGADAVLMDDRAGVVAGLARGLAVLGTIGLLDRAAQRDLVDRRRRSRACAPPTSATRSPSLTRCSPRIAFAGRRRSP